MSDKTIHKALLGSCYICPLKATSLLRWALTSASL